MQIGGPQGKDTALHTHVLLLSGVIGTDQLAIGNMQFVFFFQMAIGNMQTTINCMKLDALGNTIIGNGPPVIGSNCRQYVLRNITMGSQPRAHDQTST